MALNWNAQSELDERRVGLSVSHDLLPPTKLITSIRCEQSGWKKKQILWAYHLLNNMVLELIHQGKKYIIRDSFHTLIVASSLADTITLYTGWNMTRVTGARCPLKEYLSGGRGIHSVGERLSRDGTP